MMYMFLSTCVCRYTCMSTGVYRFLFAGICMWIPMCRDTYEGMCMWVYVCVVRVQAQMCECMHVDPSVCSCICEDVCMWVCVHASEHVQGPKENVRYFVSSCSTIFPWDKISHQASPLASRRPQRYSLSVSPTILVFQVQVVMPSFLRSPY